VWWRLHHPETHGFASSDKPAVGKLVEVFVECDPPLSPYSSDNWRKSLEQASQGTIEDLGQPTLIALAYTIEHKRKDYYAALEQNNKQLEIADWMTYFANTIFGAQNNTLQRVDFYVAKTKFYESFRSKLNERQDKVIARVFREGFDGFKGGLSAENYISITKTSRATATRDLRDLVSIGALTKTGERRHTRYHLSLPKP
jgi:Fic family protein